jgi:uncharacterized membrane-anchored protein
MALEFMTGATVFALINLILFAVACYFSYRLAVKLGSYLTSDEEDKRVNFKVEMFVMLALLAAMVFFGSVSQPKLSLDPVANRDLIEYQNQNKEVVIETPPPRTEDLQGFESLK